MRIITLDIETSPTIADVWSLWNTNVGLNQIRQASEMMCFAWKVLGEKDVQFSRGKSLLHDAYDVLDMADVLVTFNGKKFDVPAMRTTIYLDGSPPPSPFQHIDLYQIAKSNFKFVSNKLDYISEASGLGHKVRHSGHTLWQRCMAGDEKAWAEMEKYNKKDVRLTEKLYMKMRPWIHNHPVVGLYDEAAEYGCPYCGSSDVQKRGFRYTQLSKYQQYFCTVCGGWSSDGHRLQGASLRGFK